ncbi:MAG: aminotransferase class V-fold PLP-dependent enzyme, partial [Acidimicrobiia bacterium]
MAAQMPDLWSPAGTYLNTASYGLPPRPAWEALQAALEDWRHGATSWEHWQEPGEEARASFARLVGVAVEDVAVGANVSTLVGLVAASVPDGSRVLAPDVEFTSVLFPFLVQEHRGVTVRLVPAAELAGEIGPDVDVVAFSAVQMATGEVADLDAIADAAAEQGALTVVDATQAVGWMPFDAGRFDVVAAHGYKWLMSPRGTAFMSIRRERLGAVVPHAAGWFAGEDPFTSYFGPPLRLAESARRLDTSPAWFMWVGTAPTLA